MLAAQDRVDTLLPVGGTERGAIDGLPGGQFGKLMRQLQRDRKGRMGGEYDAKHAAGHRRTKVLEAARARLPLDDRRDRAPIRLD